MAQTTYDNPDFCHPWYTEMQPTWSFLEDMLAGQTKVKAAREAYLPKEAGELDSEYNARLARSLFFEDYRDCRANLTGMVFRRPPRLATDVPVEIRGLEEIRDPETQKVTQEYKPGLAENIDNAGTHLNVFLQRVFEDGFAGHSFIVVDMPSVSSDVRTAADEKALGARSYWCMRSAADATNWHWELRNGQARLTQITFKECTFERVGKFGVDEVTRYRVYLLDAEGNARWELWRELLDKKKKKTFVMEADGAILTKQGKALKRLPIAVHYGEYEGFMKSRPPLKGIADINLAYYQKYSDLTNIEHYACTVTLCVTGGDPEAPKDYSLGGNRVLNLGLGWTAEFLSVEGQSITHLENDLKTLEKRMINKGLDFIQEEHRVPTTATEVTLSYIQRTSKLSRMARSLKDAAEDALAITAEMEGLDQGGSISLGVDENALIISAEMVEKYSLMNERGQMSRQTLWEIMKNADMLPDNFDPVKEDDLLKKAALEQLELTAKQFDAGEQSTP